MDINISPKGFMQNKMISTDKHLEEIIHKSHPELLGHLERVENYVSFFCLQMSSNNYQKIKKNDHQIWGKAAFFHDIGKIRISESILMKPDKLSIEEMNIMREHPIYAKDILLELSSSSYFSNELELFSLAVLAALFHHEWWNGKGYPFRIAGEAIPLIARVTSLCDALDTIIYGRPYCKARSVNEAFSEIEACTNSQFDPQLSAFFIEHKDAFIRYFEIPT